LTFLLLAGFVVWRLTTTIPPLDGPHLDCVGEVLTTVPALLYVLLSGDRAAGERRPCATARPDGNHAFADLAGLRRLLKAWPQVIRKVTEPVHQPDVLDRHNVGVTSMSWSARPMWPAAAQRTGQASDPVPLTQDDALACS
jgi:hypothetical protein